MIGYGFYTGELRMGVNAPWHGASAGICRASGSLAAIIQVATTKALSDFSGITKLQAATKKGAFAPFLRGLRERIQI